jgi:hypothetical protein
MKLVGILNDKSFQIFKKKPEKQNELYPAEEALLKINYGKSISCKIIRSSNTKINIVSKILKDSSEFDFEDEEESLIQLTMESSYQRDVFALLITKLNEFYLNEISRADLREIHFYKRRESYLERQLQT